MDTLSPGITAERMPTSRLTVNVLEVAGSRDTGPTPEGTAVLFVHGNVSSSLFWQPMMLALPGRLAMWSTPGRASRPPGDPPSGTHKTGGVPLSSRQRIVAHNLRAVRRGDLGGV